MAAAAEMPDELIAEILLRFPPDSPASLVRASAVSKPWRRIVSDPAFLPRFRAFHRRPPILGFFSNVFAPGAAFFSTSAFSPPRRDLHDWLVLDSRHGRVLFHSMESDDEEFVVWDPVTDEKCGFPMAPNDPMRLRGFKHSHQTAAVLCAAVDGCDHLDCHGGPFLAVFLRTDIDDLTSAFVYSSESGEWRDPTPAEQVPVDFSPSMMPTVLAGNTLFFLCLFASRVELVQYDLGKRALSLIHLPYPYLPPLAWVKWASLGSIMTAEDGGLGFAGVLGSSIDLWSREPGPEGSVGWVQRRVIDLRTLLPADAFRESHMWALIGFAEGFNAIFIRTDAGVFRIDLKALQFSRLSNRTDIVRIYPYMSFYTPDHAKRLMASP